MTIGVVQFGQNWSNATGQTITLTLTLTAGNSMHVAASVDVNFDFDATTPIVSDKGETFTSLDSVAGSAGNQRMRHWSADNAVGGSTTITIKFNSVSADFRGVALNEIGTTSGYDSAAAAHAAQKQTAPGTGADGVSSGNTPALTTQPALISAFSQNMNGDNAPSAGTGFTSSGTGWDGGGGVSMRGEGKRLTSTSAVAATFTGLLNTEHLTVAAVFKETVASALLEDVLHRPALMAILAQ